MLRQVGTPYVDATPLLLHLLEDAIVPAVKVKPLQVTANREDERRTLLVVPTLGKAVATSREGYATLHSLP